MATPQLQTAIKAALNAGKIISRESLRVDTLEVHEKTQFDFFSRVDTDCQEEICRTISHYFPNDGIIAEEGDFKQHSDAESVWYIDPLDGTTNFLHGFPQYAVSIGMTYRGKLAVGVVYDPTRNELFYAEKSQGAFMNDSRIRVSGRSEFSKSLIGTGFPFRRNDDYTGFMSKFEKVARQRSISAGSQAVAWTPTGKPTSKAGTSAPEPSSFLKQAASSRTLRAVRTSSPMAASAAERPRSLRL